MKEEREGGAGRERSIDTKKKRASERESEREREREREVNDHENNKPLLTRVHMVPARRAILPRCRIRSRNTRSQKNCQRTLAERLKQPRAVQECSGSKR